MALVTIKAKDQNYDFDVTPFYNGDGQTMYKVSRVPKQREPDGLFLNLIDWTDVNKKADDWGVLAALIYLDGEYQAFAKINKPTHPDAVKLLGFFNDLVTKRNVPIKYRPDKPIPGMISLVEMGKRLKTGSTYHASTSTELAKYLKTELDTASQGTDQGLIDELSAFYTLASGFKVPKITAKRVAKAVLTGGLSEPTGRKIVSSITTGGLVNTKAGQKLAEKVDTLAVKVERKGDVLAAKAGQLFKTINLALPRSAFMSLMLVNLFGFASHLQKIKDDGEKGNKDAADRWTKVRNFWYKIGGNRAKFDKAIKTGSTHKAFLAKLSKKSGADGSIQQEMYFKKPDTDGFFGVVQVAAVAAWVGIATSVLSAIKGIAGKPKEMDAESEAAIEAEAAANKAGFDSAAAAEAANATPEFLRDFSTGAGGISGWGWVGIAAGVIGIGILTIRAIKHAKK
jgi:hypothetical protein